MKIKLFEIMSYACPECDCSCQSSLLDNGGDWIEIPDSDIEALNEWVSKQYGRYIIVREIPEKEVRNKVIDIKAVIVQEKELIRKRVEAAQAAKAKADVRKEETARLRKEKQLAKLKAELGVE